jgi:hypothetical protein
MTTEVAVVATPAQQQGWLQVANTKAQLFDALAKGELAVQGILAKIEADENLTSVQSKIKEAKAQAASDKSNRLTFTTMIEAKLIKPAMEFEKRNDSLISLAAAHELAVRKKEAEKVAKANAKEAEKANLRAFISSENYRLAAEYRLRMHNLTAGAYRMSLQQRSLVPFEDLHKILLAEPRGPFNKFNLVYLTPEEATAIFSDVPQYTIAEDQAKAIAEAMDKWSHFEFDLANAEAALAAEGAASAVRQQAVQQDVAIETATNTLVATAEVSALVQGPVVRKKLQVVVGAADQQWAKNVITGFLRNWADCASFIRVKTWDKLSLGQMAAALGQHASATGERVTGLEYEEVEK